MLRNTYNDEIYNLIRLFVLYAFVFTSGYPKKFKLIFLVSSGWIFRYELHQLHQLHQLQWIPPIPHLESSTPMDSNGKHLWSGQILPLFNLQLQWTPMEN